MIGQKKRTREEVGQDKQEEITNEIGKDKEKNKKENREKKIGKDNKYVKDKRINKEDDKKVNSIQKKRLAVPRSEEEVHLPISVVPLHHLPVQVIPQHEIIIDL